MATRNHLTTALLTALFLTATSHSSAATYVSPDGNMVMEADTVQAEAKVLAVDKEKRTLKLQTRDGKETTITAGDEVRNFDKIKKGDVLKISYLESLAVELKEKGQAPIAANQTVDVTRSEPGQKPSGKVVNKVTVTGTITKIDKKNQAVTIEGPNRTVSMHVKKKDVFDKIKKGDQVEATYTEALAISVESVKK